MSYGKGNNPYNQKQAVVDATLTNHCWVIFTEGEKYGVRKKITKENLSILARSESHVETTPAATSGAATGAQPEPAATGSTGNSAWESASRVL